MPVRACCFETFASQRVRAVPCSTSCAGPTGARQARKQVKNRRNHFPAGITKPGAPRRTAGNCRRALGLSLDDYRDARCLIARATQLVYYEDFAVDEDQGGGSVVEIADVRQVDPIDILQRQRFFVMVWSRPSRPCPSATNW